MNIPLSLSYITLDDVIAGALRPCGKVINVKMDSSQDVYVGICNV